MPSSGESSRQIILVKSFSKQRQKPLRNQMENKMSKINIDASLQSFMDHHVTIARGTFAKDANDETLTNSALLAFAGMGLVKLVCGPNGPTWFPTDLLIELSKELADQSI